jgi:hypothetical protein
MAKRSGFLPAYCQNKSLAGYFQVCAWGQEWLGGLVT